MSEQLYINEKGLRLCLDGIGETESYRGFISEGEHGFYLESMDKRKNERYNIEDGDVILIRMTPFSSLHRYIVNLGERG